MLTPQEVAESIREHIEINELHEQEELSYEYVMSNYVPMVMYWLDDNGLAISEDNIEAYKHDISDFVNCNTMESLKASLMESEDIKVKKVKSNIPKLLIVVAIIAIGVYLYKNN